MLVFKKIADLDSQASMQLAQLRQSMQDKNYSMVKDQYTTLQDILKQKTDTMSKMFEQTMAYEKDLRDYNYKAATNNVENQLKSAQLNMQQKKDIFEQAMSSAQFDATQRKQLRDEYFRQQDFGFQKQQIAIANQLASDKMSYQQQVS